MAAKVLKGESKASEMNFETISEVAYKFSAAENLNIEIDGNMRRAIETFDTIAGQ